MERTTVPLRAVAYLRTSTDDKGQNPERQLDLIKEWAAREGVDLVAYRTDEGTSGASSPLDRSALQETIRVARDTKAEAIVVEAVDRFTREGVKIYGWACVEMERRYNLELWMADAPLKQQKEMGGMVVASLQAEMGRAWLERHRRAVQSGMDRAKANGQRMGRPPKGFSDAEKQYIVRERGKGTSGGKIAAAINEERGVHRLSDVRARKKRATSGSSVLREYERLTASPKPEPTKSPPEQGEVVAGA